MKITAAVSGTRAGQSIEVALAVNGGRATFGVPSANRANAVTFDLDAAELMGALEELAARDPAQQAGKTGHGAGVAPSAKL